MARSAKLAISGQPQLFPPHRLIGTLPFQSQAARSARRAAREGVIRDMRRALITLVLLTVCNAVSVLDRTMMDLFVDPIRHSTGLSDLQFSFIQGPAFAIAYILLGVPFGRLVDRGNRKVIITTAVAFWSTCTMAFGFGGSFLTLAISRAGVAAGEAALAPAAFSMIPDLFPRRLVGRTLSLFAMGGLAGIGLAMLTGGTLVAALGTGPVPVLFLGSFAPWQIVFFITGGAGLVVSFLVLVAAREPVRSTRELMPPLALVVRTVWQERRFYVLILFALAALAVVVAAHGAWAPTYLIRTYGRSAGQVGQQLGLILLVANILGTLLSGWLADWLYDRRGNAAALVIMRVEFALLLPAAVIAYGASSYFWTLLGCALLGFLTAGLLALGPVAVQLHASARMRGQLGAVQVVVSNVFGRSLGPMVVPALAQLVFVGQGLGPALMGTVLLFASLGFALCLLTGKPKAASLVSVP